MSKKILIADDLASSRIMLEGLLKKQGHQTLGVDGGYRCLQVAKKEKPDLILLDIIMPDLDGIEVCRQLRGHPVTAVIPIIFVTTATDDKTLSNAFDAGANDYIRKPVNRMELVKRIQAVFVHELLTVKQQEEEQLRKILAMNGTICHELNQPLQYISGMLDILEMDHAKDFAILDKVSKMQQQVERMAKITKKLQSITRLETKNYVGSSKIFDLGQ